uniref:Protein LMBR1L n=1 Tax=Syphacia muris TaxID=451379 RepID=A0A0N5AL31_9BILA
MDAAEDYEETEKRFYEFVRRHLIYLLLFIFLYLISYSLLRYYKKRCDYDELYAGKEDFFVFRTSLWMCTCSLAVSFAAATLLPFSVIGSEIIHTYPNSYYFKWLNWPLIHTLWNYIFGLSNLSLFILLPFAYFFIESQGIKGHGKGIMARVYETLAVCTMLIVLIASLADIIRAFFFSRTLSISLSIINFASVNLPFVYSCVSLFGVLALLITTPFGFTRMFTVTANHLLAVHLDGQPDHRSNSGEEFKYDELQQKRQKLLNGHISCLPPGNPSLLSFPLRNSLRHRSMQKRLSSSSLSSSSSTVTLVSSPSTPLLHFGKQSEPFLPEKPLRGYQKVLQTIKYPIAIIVLLVLTMVSVLMVIINILQLIIGYRALPVYVRYINVNSRHIFGIFGAFVEVIIIWYFMLASIVGLYSAPILKKMRPLKAETSMTCIVANCTTVLILSSAFPVLARTLGITTFDLLGEYGNLDWLSNLKLVLAYNVLFLIPTVFCLVNHFTAPVRREVVRRFAHE